jgi:hypothetical protein
MILEAGKFKSMAPTSGGDLELQDRWWKGKRACVRRKEQECAVVITCSSNNPPAAMLIALLLHRAKPT